MLIITEEEKSTIEVYIETIKRNYIESTGRDIAYTRMFDTNTGVSYGAPKDSRAQDSYASFYDYSIDIFRSKIPKSLVKQYELINLFASQNYGKDLIRGVRAYFEKIFSAIYQMFLNKYSDNDALLLTDSFIFGCNIVLLRGVNVTFVDKPSPSTLSQERLLEGDDYERIVIDEAEYTDARDSDRDLGIELSTQLSANVGTGAGTAKSREEEEEEDDDGKCNIFRFLNQFISTQYLEFKARVDKARQDAADLRAAEQEHTTLSEAAAFPSFLISVQIIVEQNNIAKNIKLLISAFMIGKPDSFDTRKVDLFVINLSDYFILLKKAYGIKKSVPEGIKLMISILDNAEISTLEKIRSIRDIAQARLGVDDKIRSNATREVYSSLTKINEQHLKSINISLEKQEEAARRRDRSRLSHRSRRSRYHNKGKGYRVCSAIS